MSAKNVKELVESINSAYVSILLSEIGQSIETLYSLKLKIYNIQRILEIIKLDHSIENIKEDSSTEKEIKQSEPIEKTEKIHNIFRPHSAAYWCFEYFKNKPDRIDYESYMKDKLPDILGNTLKATKSYVSSQIYKRFKVSHIR